MKTLIELYVNERFDDLSAVMTFAPERTVFLCSGSIPDRATRESIARFVSSVREGSKAEFINVGNRSIETLLGKIEEITAAYPDCAIDMTGGAASVLIAAERFSSSHRAKSFYFDDIRGKYRNIYGMEAELAPLGALSIDVRRLIELGGGKVTGNKHSTAANQEDAKLVRALFDVYAGHIGEWNSLAEYLQYGLRHCYDADRQRFSAPSAMLNNGYPLKSNRRLLGYISETGAIKELDTEGDHVSFTFENTFVREVLTTVGACLELFVYMSATDCAHFDSAEMSVEFDWDGASSGGFDDTTNEIDVIMTKGVRSYFVSCKTARPDTRDLYEISYLAKRFGGRSAQAVIATAADLSGEAWSLYRRARDMGVAVIERNDIRAGMQHVSERILHPEWYDEKPIGQ
jgi:hypothetical protein